MEQDEQVASAAIRLRQANSAALAEEVIDRLAPQLADVVGGLRVLEERLPLESEPATVERVDEGDW